MSAFNNFKVDFELVEPMVAIGFSDLEGLHVMLKELQHAEFTDQQKVQLFNRIMERIDFLNEFDRMSRSFEEAKRSIVEARERLDNPKQSKRQIGFDNTQEIPKKVIGFTLE